MSQLERIYEIDRRLRRKQPLNKREIIEKFGISEAQFKRDLEYLRSRLGATINWDRQAGGYRYGNEDFNLPGLWFSSMEIQALLTLEALLEQFQPGLVRDELEPFARKLRFLIDIPPFGAGAIRERVRVVNTLSRPVEPDRFQLIATATLERKRLWMRYLSRHRGVETERTISPAQLIFHRGTWYVDAWCHAKNQMRRFALDAVREVRLTDERAFEPPGGTGNRTGYGIFAGAPQATAVLQFDATAALWVSQEDWHPDQKATPLPDGGLQLEVPYSHPEEILMDILRHGAHVEVIAPPALRDAVALAHHEAAARYESPRRAPGKVAAPSRPAAARKR